MTSEWAEEIYQNKCDNGEYPRPGFFKIKTKKEGDYLPADIRYGVPLDPFTGVILDRSPGLDAFINDTPADIKEVWAWGKPIDRKEFKWLRAITAIRQMNP